MGWGTGWRTSIALRRVTAVPVRERCTSHPDGPPLSSESRHTYHETSTAVFDTTPPIASVRSIGRSTITSYTPGVLPQSAASMGFTVSKLSSGFEGFAMKHNITKVALGAIQRRTDREASIRS